MGLLNQDLTDAFQRKDSVEEASFEDFWPSPTAGNGFLAKNNVRSGAAQGKASFVRKAYCRNCGYPLDLSQNDHTGGSLDGNGAGGSISTATYSATLPNGTIHTEKAGRQTYNNGAGCPLCFSKNSSKERIETTSETNPWNRIAPLGF